MCEHNKSLQSDIAARAVLRLNSNVRHRNVRYLVDCCVRSLTLLKFMCYGSSSVYSHS